MTVLGIDDTDSREQGMCTTYVATRVREALRRRGARIDWLRLVRLNPAVEHKTRGNAAIAIRTDARPAEAVEVATEVIEEFAELADDRTHPGVVAAEEPISARTAEFGERAITEILDRRRAIDHVRRLGYESAGWKLARGTIGALAAIGASRALSEWTYEYIAYREPSRWGTPRQVDRESVFRAAEAYYPRAWDTVDRAEGEAVCVPNAPGPILYGIRGDEANAVAALAGEIDSEPIHDRTLFLTNQGTDVHLQEASIAETRDASAYRVTGRVISAPETGPGGHVHFVIADGTGRLPSVAFEPTKRFRDHVRRLRVGDEVTVAGEVGDGTLKLEKFALRDRVSFRARPPVCPDCGRRMESAGRSQGYRCRDCERTAERKSLEALDRDIEVGWYEVPPCARRHVAKPLIRGGFDAPTHPER